MKTPVSLLAALSAALSFATPGSAADSSAPRTPGATPVASAAGSNLLRPTADPKSWQFEQIEEGTGTIKADGDALELNVTHVDGTDWHVQAYQLGLDLKEGREYAVTLKVRSSVKRTVQLYAGINEEDYHSVGLDEPVDLTPEWKELKYTFKAEGTVPKNNRIGFILGQETGKVWVRDFVLTAK